MNGLPAELSLFAFCAKSDWNGRSAINAFARLWWDLHRLISG
jgi:hypothetical protein